VPLPKKPCTCCHIQLSTSEWSQIDDMLHGSVPVPETSATWQQLHSNQMNSLLVRDPA
jgi:hypothetical protein